MIHAEKRPLLACSVTKEFKRRSSFSPVVYGTGILTLQYVIFTRRSYLVSKHPSKSVRAFSSKRNDVVFDFSLLTLIFVVFKSFFLSPES